MGNCATETCCNKKDKDFCEPTILINNDIQDSALNEFLKAKEKLQLDQNLLSNSNSNSNINTKMPFNRTGIKLRKFSKRVSLEIQKNITNIKNLNNNKSIMSYCDKEIPNSNTNTIINNTKYITSPLLQRLAKFGVSYLMLDQSDCRNTKELSNLLFNSNNSGNIGKLRNSISQSPDYYTKCTNSENLQLNRHSKSNKVVTTNTITNNMILEEEEKLSPELQQINSYIAQNPNISNGLNQYIPNININANNCEYYYQNITGDFYNNDIVNNSGNFQLNLSNSLRKHDSFNTKNRESSEHTSNIQNSNNYLNTGSYHYKNISSVTNSPAFTSKQINSVNNSLFNVNMNSSSKNNNLIPISMNNMNNYIDQSSSSINNIRQSPNNNLLAINTINNMKKSCFANTNNKNAINNQTSSVINRYSNEFGDIIEENSIEEVEIAEEDEDLIQKTLEKTFPKLSISEIRVLMLNFFYEVIEKNSIIYDFDEGNKLLFIVKKGKVALVEDQAQKITFQRGDCFGNIVNLDTTDTKPNLKLISIEECELFIISVEVIEKIKKEIFEKNNEQIIRRLNSITLFKNLDHNDKLSVIDNMQIENISKNIIIQDCQDKEISKTDSNEINLISLIQNNNINSQTITPKSITKEIKNSSFYYILDGFVEKCLIDVNNNTNNNNNNTNSNTNSNILSSILKNPNNNTNIKNNNKVSMTSKTTKNNDKSDISTTIKYNFKVIKLLKANETFNENTLLNVEEKNKFMYISKGCTIIKITTDGLKRALGKDFTNTLLFNFFKAISNSNKYLYKYLNNIYLKEKFDIAAHTLDLINMSLVNNSSLCESDLKSQYINKKIFIGYKLEDSDKDSDVVSKNNDKENNLSHYNKLFEKFILKRYYSGDVVMTKNEIKLLIIVKGSIVNCVTKEIFKDSSIIYKELQNFDEYETITNEAFVLEIPMKELYSLDTQVADKNNLLNMKLFLKKCEWLNFLSNESLIQLASYIKEITIKENKTIISKNSEFNYLFCIKSGRVDVCSESLEVENSNSNNNNSNNKNNTDNNRNSEINNNANKEILSIKSHQNTSTSFLTNITTKNNLISHKNINNTKQFTQKTSQKNLPFSKLERNDKNGKINDNSNAKLPDSNILSSYTKHQIIGEQEIFFNMKAKNFYITNINNNYQTGTLNNTSKYASQEIGKYSIHTKDKETRELSINQTNQVKILLLPKFAFRLILSERMINTISNYIYYMNNNKSLELKKLKLITFLGQGAFGMVNLVSDTSYYYALKSIYRGLIRKKSYLINYIIQEKESLINCNSPFIVKLLKTFKDEKFSHFLMEYVEGSDLGYLEESGLIRLKNNDVLFYTINILLMLEHLKKHNIIHRDIKLNNIMINSTGYLKLVDFGLSKLVKDYTYTTIGTPYYMAPEVILGRGYTYHCDYWSAGVTIYKMIYGSFPFGDSCINSMEIYQSILNNNVKSLPIVMNIAKSNDIVNSKQLDEKMFIRSNQETANVISNAQIYDLIILLLEKNPKSRICSLKETTKFISNILISEVKDMRQDAPYIPKFCLKKNAFYNNDDNRLINNKISKKSCNYVNFEFGKISSMNLMNAKSNNNITTHQTNKYVNNVNIYNNNINKNNLIASYKGIDYSQDLLMKKSDDKLLVDNEEANYDSSFIELEKKWIEHF